MFMNETRSGCQGFDVTTRNLRGPQHELQNFHLRLKFWAELVNINENGHNSKVMKFIIHSAKLWSQQICAEIIFERIWSSEWWSELGSHLSPTWAHTIKGDQQFDNSFWRLSSGRTLHCGLPTMIFQWWSYPLCYRSDLACQPGSVCSTKPRDFYKF